MTFPARSVAAPLLGLTVLVVMHVLAKLGIQMDFDAVANLNTPGHFCFFTIHAAKLA